MILTVVFDPEALQNLVGYTGADLSENGCKAMKHSYQTAICQFDLKANGSNFGILFQGGYNPLFYKITWKETFTWTPAFDWW